MSIPVKVEQHVDDQAEDLPSDAVLAEQELERSKPEEARNGLEHENRHKFSGC